MTAHISEVTVAFIMANGSCFECKYQVKTIYGRLSGPPESCYPDESEVSEPEYFIDDVEVTFDKLPKGLDNVARAMYEDNKPGFDFTVTEKEVDSRDDEPYYDRDEEPRYY